MIADNLKKFNKSVNALVLDASYAAIDLLMKKMQEADIDIDDLKDIILEVREDIKKSLTEAVTVKATKKAKKEKKDPSAPKIATTAFMFFSNEVRPKIREEEPELKLTEISKKIGAMWKEMDEDDKKPYNDKAARDKVRYEKEKAAYAEANKK